MSCDCNRILYTRRELGTDIRRNSLLSLGDNLQQGYLNWHTGSIGQFSTPTQLVLTNYLLHPWFISVLKMGMSQSSTRYILWAAQDGRLNDLIYHLKYAKPEMLECSSLVPNRRAAIHLAAAGGHSSCVHVLREAGKGLEMFALLFLSCNIFL